MFNTLVVWQLLRPLRRQRGHHQGCLEMRQGFCTQNRIKAELEEEEGTQWRPLASLTTLWEPRGQMDHLLQHLAQEALVC